jgi:hypothetical protein
MKSTDFKKIIKEAVREAIQEELKDILLEAVRAPKLPVMEAPVGGVGFGLTNSPIVPQPSTTSATEKRAMMESIMGDMRRGQDTISMTTANLNSFQVPTGVNTSAEGTSLPQGNVGLDQIMALMNK